MKIYLFYLRIVQCKGELLSEVDDINESITLRGESVSLYAHTNKKKYMKEFTKQRNMDKFFLTSVCMSEDEYEKFSNSYRAGCLHYYQYDTRSIDGEFISCQILTTCLESEVYWNRNETVFDDLEEIFLYDMCVCYTFGCLKKKWANAIGSDECGRIMHMCRNLAIGEPIDIAIDGVEFLLDSFDEIFKVRVIK